MYMYTCTHKALTNYTLLDKSNLFPQDCITGFPLFPASGIGVSVRLQIWRYHRGSSKLTSARPPWRFALTQERFLSDWHFLPVYLSRVEDDRHPGLHGKARSCLFIVYQSWSTWLHSDSQCVEHCRVACILYMYTDNKYALHVFHSQIYILWITAIAHVFTLTIVRKCCSTTVHV